MSEFIIPPNHFGFKAKKLAGEMKGITIQPENPSH
jgi:hypothetical protein